MKKSTQTDNFPSEIEMNLRNEDKNHVFMHLDKKNGRFQLWSDKKYLKFDNLKLLDLDIRYFDSIKVLTNKKKKYWLSFEEKKLGKSFQFECNTKENATKLMNTIIHYKSHLGPQENKGEIVETPTTTTSGNSPQFQQININNTQQQQSLNQMAQFIQMYHTNPQLLQQMNPQMYQQIALYSNMMQMQNTSPILNTKTQDFQNPQQTSPTYNPFQQQISSPRGNTPSFIPIPNQQQLSTSPLQNRNIQFSSTPPIHLPTHKYNSPIFSPFNSTPNSPINSPLSSPRNRPPNFSVSPPPKHMQFSSNPSSPLSSSPNTHHHISNPFHKIRDPLMIDPFSSKHKVKTKETTVPALIFLNKINKIGRKLRPDLFDEDYEWAEVSRGIYAEVKLEGDPNPSLNPTNSPLEDLNEKDLNLEKLLTHMLSKRQNHEEEAVAKKFFELIKRFEAKVKEIVESIKIEGEKLIFKVFGNHTPINHIFGKKWKNFGETLLLTPAHIFSDYSKECAGYLYFQNGDFFLQKKLGGQKVKIAVDHLPSHYHSPITKEHLLAIVNLAKVKKLVIKVKISNFFFFFTYNLFFKGFWNISFLVSYCIYKWYFGRQQKDQD
eukprot:TRINITY_DN3407_c0_g1_i1.p1 TRINITY_DN3407_c0_g1~~TRINITY_DN3407_c0_g1_i1.p1  ORF type:complete len:604 (-),score=162.63 TRINITY_DN3407_c0_g1_i1:1828-3639(-)